MHRLGDMIIGIAGIVVFIILAVWLGWRALRNSDDPTRLIVKWILTVLFLGIGFPVAVFSGTLAPLIMLLFAVPAGLIWAPSVGEFIASPLTTLFEGGRAEVDPTPVYSSAEAKRQRGNYQAALADIRQQLEKFPGDFRGNMLIASIQAEDLHDLPSAQLTVERLLENPDLPVAPVAASLHTMADWALKYAQDVPAAREYLERIVLRFPDSPQAHMAAQRIASLGTGYHTVEAPPVHKFQVKHGERNIGLHSEPKRVVQETQTSTETAAALVKQLEAHPLDTAAREKLAVVYADEFKRIDLAADQLEQLIAVPAETPKNIARWLNLLATLHIKVNSDRRAAEDALRRIVDLYPKSALADVARQRLAYIEAELKNKEAPSLKLGTYERNLGLKRTTTQ
jgi:tetratricopeptide (TPR) repeat protein